MCSINNKGRVEHHLEFWILVAGDELDWVEYVSDGNDDVGDALVNIVSMPGHNNNNNNVGNCIGMFGDVIGTVNKCQVNFVHVRFEIEIISFSACLEFPE